MSNQAPKKLPSLRESNSPEQLDVFQREVRKVFRGVQDELAELVDLPEALEALQEEVDGIALSSGVSSVNAGSSAVSVSPTTGAVVVDVVEGNFSGIPQAGVTNLVADLAAKAPLVHTHPESDITGLVADLAAITGDIATLQSDLTALEADVITEVIAGTNLSGGGSSGSVTLNVVDSPSFAGNVTCGNSAAADLLTVNGKAEMTSTQDDSAFEITLNGVGMTAVNSACLRVSNISTVSTAAGNNNTAGVWSTVTATESGGANTLTNIAGFFSASGGDVNEAIRTDAGNINLNRTGGTTTIGGATTINNTLNTTGNVTLGDAAGDAHTANGSLTVTNGLSVTGGNASVTNNLSCNGNATLGNSFSSDVHTINGAFSAQSQGTTADAFLVTYSGGAQTVDHSAQNTLMNGSFNCTAASRISYGTVCQNLATRSAGANALTNYGLFCTAANGTTNIALYTNLGDVRVCQGGGAFSCAGAVTFSSTLAVNGNVTIGDAAGDAHVVNGTLDCNQAVNIDGALTCTSTVAIDGNTTIGNATSDSHVANGKFQVNTTSGGQCLVVQGATNGLTDGQLKVVSHKNAWGNVTGQITTTAGGSTSSDDVKLSIDSGSITLQPGGGTSAIVIEHGGNIRIGSTAGPIIKAGSGTPEGAVTAPVGSMFLRTDGGAGTSLYIKESGAGNTGWVGK